MSHNYVQHIFPGRAKKILGWASPPPCAPLVTSLIRCGATTNFNVKCLVYNCRQPTRIFVCEVQNETFYAIFSNWWHIESIREFCSENRETGNEKSRKFPGIPETGIPVSKPISW